MSRVVEKNREKRRDKRMDSPIRKVSRTLGIAGALMLLAIVLKDRRRIPERVRAFNKHVFNPLVLKSAGTPDSPFAVIQHVGRRSGKVYETPLLVAPVVDGFVITLTYGLGVDWYRNMQAAGKCIVLWHGREYISERSELLDTETALLAFPPTLRLLLRLLDRQCFVKLAA